MKKCVFFVIGLEQGGIETYLLRFLKYNNGKNYNIIWCKSGTSGVLYDAYKEVANEIIVQKPLGYFSIWAYIRLFLYLKNKHIDTVCDFTGNFAGLPLVCARFANVKKRLSFYRGSTNHFKETYPRLIYNFLMKRLVLFSATRILSNSCAALDFFYPMWKKDENRYKVIYNEVGPDYLRQINVTRTSMRNKLGIPQNAYIVGHIGRYNEAKNHETILRVAQKLCKEFKDIYFVLAGKDTDKYLSDYIAKEGLDRQIRILGYRNDAPNLLQAFDLFYFPSITEGQPNALIEAMVCGIPVLASNINPIKESVPKSLYDYLIPAKSVDLAYNNIREYYLHREKLNVLTCQNWAVNYYCANKWFDLFEKELV